MLSFLLLFLGFIANSLAWHYTLTGYQIHVNPYVSIASSGLSVFAKYIPGKVMVILGRSAYISSNTGISIKKTVLVSLSAQLIAIWVGLLVGSFSFFLPGQNPWLMYSSLSVWGVLTVIIFSERLLAFFEKRYNRYFKKSLQIPRLSFMSTLRILPMYFINWALWSASYYFLIVSLTSDQVPLSTAFGFSLASTAGILALLTPGGLGVREGILAGLLLLAGIDKVDAVTISIAARGWFLIGEFFIFLMAVGINFILVKPFID